ncbi:hypothetical protein D3C73_1134160 [compost metagenome]
MAQAERRVVTGNDLPGRQLQHLQRSLFRQPGETAAAQRDITPETAGSQRLHLRLQGFTQFAAALHHGRQRPLCLGKGIGAEQQRGGQHHAAETGGHGKALIVGTLWHHQRTDVIALMGILRQLAVRIAHQHQVIAFRQQLIGQLHRCHAFRAVAGASERHQQRRASQVEILVRVGDNIGGAVGHHVATGFLAQPGCQCPTGKG